MNEIIENFMGNQVFAPIGAKSTIFKIALKSGERTQYNFADFDIPENARVLYINYTPIMSPGGSCLIPLEVHGNVSTRRFIGDQMTLFPMPIGDTDLNIETQVNVLVTWIDHTINDDAWLSLVDAFVAYEAERYDELIIPANVAVESKLSRVLASYLKEFTDKKSIDTFLNNAATYNYQLNVIVPLITSLSGLTKMPKEILNILNKLRKFRNKIAHNGKLEERVSRNDAAEILCAALFGFYYVRLIEKEQKAETKKER